jgi:hypothetical protein
MNLKALKEKFQHLNLLISILGHFCPPDPGPQHCYEVVALLFQLNGAKRDLQTSE